MSDESLITNLDVARVTWAPTFIDSARKAGWNVSQRPNDNSRLNLFIGDVIADSDLTENAISLYFLAAVEGLDAEIESIEKTDATVVPSSHTITRAQEAFGRGIAQKLHVLGFPLDLDHIARFRSPDEDKIPKSVAFLGETRDVKNPDFEIALVRSLVDRGFSCFHSSPGAISRNRDLRRAGAHTLEGLSGDEYHRHLGRMEFAVCTSSDESLYVSGIEAALLGAVPVLPDNPQAGYMDWCDRTQLYEPLSVEDALRIVEQPRPRIDQLQTSLTRYDFNEFFNRASQLGRSLRA